MTFSPYYFRHKEVKAKSLSGLKDHRVIKDHGWLSSLSKVTAFIQLAITPEKACALAMNLKYEWRE